MIHFRPCTTTGSTNEITFEAVENDVVCGSCHMVYSSDKATVDALSFEADKPYLVEGLLKSAFNFAVQKNIYMGYCTCENITHFLDNMSFEKKDGIYVSDIPSILMGNCCKKRDNI